MTECVKSGKKFSRLVGIMARLRGDKGCPWDRIQDEKSITDYFLEEVYEAVDALGAEDPPSIAEELGDVLMEIVFLSRIYQEKGAFSIEDVLDGINTKMIRRHPHVFAEKQDKTPGRVVQDWNRQKSREKGRKSIFDGFLEQGPALFQSFQAARTASSVGFDWENPLGALDKVREEVEELEAAITTKKCEDITDEVGDLLFSVANVSRLHGINPELALRRANKKFIRRFKAMENLLDEKGIDLEGSSLAEMDAAWDEVKKKA